MALIVVLLGLFNFFFGEKLTAGGGLGWDGSQYAAVARDFGSIIANGELGSYYAQRILPSAIVHGMLRVTGSALTNQNVIRCFELYNLVLLVVACGVWRRICDSVALSHAGRWLGFSGIFLNFECSKQAFFYTVLTDVSALLTTMLLLMFFLQRKRAGLLITTIVGSFAWPVVSVCGALLLLFMGTAFPARIVAPIPSPTPFHMTRTKFVAYAGGALLTCSAGVLAWMMRKSGAEGHACPLPDVIAHTVVPCTLERVVTGLPALAAMAVALTLLVRLCALPSVISGVLRKVQWRSLASAIAAIAVPSLIIRAISNPVLPNPSNIFYLIEFMLMPPPGKLLLPLVTLTAFWGPLFLLMILRWDACCVEARRLGPGVVAVLFISLPLGLACEPRFITVAWPFLVLILVLALEHSNVRMPHRSALIVLTILYGQWWLPINLVPWSPPDYANLLDFPKQLYFMHYGLWMSWTSYLLQLPIVILSLVWLGSAATGIKRNEENVQPQ